MGVGQRVPPAKVAYKVPLVVGQQESCRRRWGERLSPEEVEYAKKVVGKERQNLGMCNVLHWSASAREYRAGLRGGRQSQ